MVRVHGTVGDASHKPLHMIRVLAIQGGREVGRAYTSDDGSYSFDVPSGLMTLNFDTHGTLTNARDWHPSVVTNIDANVDTPDLRCDRVLMKGGTASSDEACVDALAGCMYSLMWTARVSDRAYAEAAAARLSSMKMPAPELLDHFRSQLRDLFAKRAEQTSPWPHRPSGRRMGSSGQSGEGPGMVGMREDVRGLFPFRPAEYRLTSALCAIQAYREETIHGTL